MNETNLINPYSPLAQRKFAQWFLFTKIVVAVGVSIIVVITGKLIKDSYHLKQEIRYAQKKINSDILQKYEMLDAKNKKIMQQRALLRQWQQPTSYYELLLTIAESTPAFLKLQELYFDQTEVVFKGNSVTIEVALDFIHTLVTTHQWLDLQLVEVQPSTEQYENKNLVYFIIKGKLKHQ